MTMKTLDPDSWLQGLGQIEDRTRQNYFSLFPDESQIKTQFEDGFVINRPMSNVGGDGYWLHEKDGVVFLVVFDCVGQGHLASMMTRIYANALRKLIVENGIIFPVSILQFIHREIQKKFKDKEHIQLNTGADLGILKYDKKAKTIEFAGAGMNMIRAIGKEIGFIEGEKGQIGETLGAKKEYSSTILEAKTKSMYYLYTDGVTGLIGGPSYKKFGFENLRSLVMEHNRLPMEPQKQAIVNGLKAWQGSNMQNDDILMIGVKI